MPYVNGVLVLSLMVEDPYVCTVRTPCTVPPYLPEYGYAYGYEYVPYEGDTCLTIVMTRVRSLTCRPLASPLTACQSISTLSETVTVLAVPCPRARAGMAIMSAKAVQIMYFVYFIFPSPFLLKFPCL